MRTKWARILASGDKGLSSARGILPALVRKILNAGVIGELEWERRAQAFLADPKNGLDDTRKRNGFRGNLRAALEDDQNLSWRRFMDFISVIKPKRITLTLKLEFDDREAIDVEIQHEMED